MRRALPISLGLLTLWIGAALAQQSPTAPLVLYAAVGPELTVHGVDVTHGTLTKSATARLPFPVQYVWFHPSKRFLYAAWSNGMQGDRHGVTAFQISEDGTLVPHGAPIELRHRPVHVTVDANASHVLVAYNNPSGLSVHTLKADGTLGQEIPQPAVVDGGIYAHQIRVHPSNQMVVLVTRGNGPAPDRPEDPGALKVFAYKDGVLTPRQSIAPNKGYGFQPRHVDFHPTQPWMYLNLERQNQLQVYKVMADHQLDPAALFTVNTLDDPGHSKPAQMTGAIHVHPNGRFIYISNRASGTTPNAAAGGRPVWEGGENTIGVYSIDQKSGEPVRIQNIDSHGMHARTFTLDEQGRILIAANQTAVTKLEGSVEVRVPASLALFRIGADGKLTFVRKYDVETGGSNSLMWTGLLTPNNTVSTQRR